MAGVFPTEILFCFPPFLFILFFDILRWWGGRLIHHHFPLLSSIGTINSLSLLFSPFYFCNVNMFSTSFAVRLCWISAHFLFKGRRDRGEGGNKEKGHLQWMDMRGRGLFSCFGSSEWRTKAKNAITISKWNHKFFLRRNQDTQLRLWPVTSKRDPKSEGKILNILPFKWREWVSSIDVCSSLWTAMN